LQTIYQATRRHIPEYCIFMNKAKKTPQIIHNHVVA